MDLFVELCCTSCFGRGSQNLGKTCISLSQQSKSPFFLGFTGNLDQSQTCPWPRCSVAPENTGVAPLLTNAVHCFSGRKESQRVLLSLTIEYKDGPAAHNMIRESQGVAKGNFMGKFGFSTPETCDKQFVILKDQGSSKILWYISGKPFSSDD